MPVFEYKCVNCGHVMEILEKTTAARKHKCAKCNSSNLQKLLSGFAVGQSKSASPSCDSCPTSPCPAGTCPLS